MGAYLPQDDGGVLVPSGMRCLLRGVGFQSEDGAAWSPGWRSRAACQAGIARGPRLGWKTPPSEIKDERALLGVLSGEPS